MSLPIPPPALGIHSRRNPRPYHLGACPFTLTLGRQVPVATSPWRKVIGRGLRAPRTGSLWSGNSSQQEPVMSSSILSQVSTLSTFLSDFRILSLRAEALLFHTEPELRRTISAVSLGAECPVSAGQGRTGSCNQHPAHLPPTRQSLPFQR